jgi:hypothetical protein
MAETDPWTDLADDIRRAARTAEDRVAELEAALERHRAALRGVLGVPAIVGGDHCAACDCASGYHEEGCPVADACDVLGPGAVSARAPAAADKRVAELGAEVKALDEDRGDLMRVLAAQTGETMRLRGVCEQAIATLREDRPQAALALIEEATRA